MSRGGGGSGGGGRECQRGWEGMGGGRGVGGGGVGGGMRGEMQMRRGGGDWGRRGGVGE